MGAVAEWVRALAWAGDRTVSRPGSNPATVTSLRNFGNSVYPALPVSFGGDTKSRRSLLSGVYARGSKRFFKNKEDPMNCGNYRGTKPMCHSMKLYERVHQNRLRNMSISEEHFGFMNGKSTTDAIFSLRQLQERYREGQQDLHCIH